MPVSATRCVEKETRQQIGNSSSFIIPAVLVRANVHLERIAPGRAPGGVWIRVCTIDRLVTEYAATDPATVGISAEHDGELAVGTGADRVWVYFYDGDSGECLRTLITNN